MAPESCSSNALDQRKNSLIESVPLRSVSAWSNHERISSELNFSRTARGCIA